MTDRELYTLTIPADSQTSAQTEVRRNTTTRGVLGEDAGAVESLSAAPDRRTLRGQYRGKYAELMATELAELFEASEYESVAYAATSEATPADGYYTPGTLGVRRLDPRDGAVVSFDGDLTRVGTRDSHRRAVETAVVQVENDFGNDQTAHVGIPAEASDVRWFDPETGVVEPANEEFVETRAAEYGGVAVYNLNANSLDLSDPTLLYDLPYDASGKTDAKVWDDRGTSKFDADGLTQWQRAFVTDHGFDGSSVLDNGLARLTFDRSSGLRAEQWSAQDDAWLATSLGSSSWEFDAFDLTRVGPSRVEAQVRFRDASATATTFHLDASLKRGYRSPQWVVPENETGPVPSGLKTLLKPIADASDYDPQANRELVARQEVRT